MAFNLTNLQIFFTNLIFGNLFFTMCLYWILLVINKKGVLYEIAKFGGLVATVLISTFLSWRWYQYNHFPLSNLYESLMFLSCLLLFFYKTFEYKTDSKIIGGLCIPLILLIQGFATLNLPLSLQKATPLVPALQSNWLMLHVSMMMLSYATLLVGSLFSILYFFISNDKLISKQTSTKLNPIFRGSNIKIRSDLEFNFNEFTHEKEVISINFLKKKNRSHLLTNLDNWSYRTIGLGFPFLTMGIISGGIWANEAWGSYWSWDPKETWAFITWLIFASYLHARIIRDWQGKKTAFIGSLGFFTVWVCYLGVNFLGQGLHNYGFLN
uniref:cytochrome c biogenesis protein n=1 Tax=Haramonas pauciplastida TaxID=478668 RepID=UPI0021157678|nr:cytochrome c biogenesis protein [Haramonas pauciplastida]YP_010444185.1 cytochrome c biogenesis protein [Haramonas pauciplastida]UTE95027.1 cytochrome c biogenesis protein [Haramonas pauciplastida]UTE95071.1 cytochrome c biogenesis protein [Haramonas pauciplastida]